MLLTPSANRNPSSPSYMRAVDEIFEKHREFLVDRIDSDSGLLDKLLASKTVTRELLHKIKLRDNTPEDRNRILLDFILENKKANELITALRDSGQTHLVNYLNADGEREHAFGYDWPLTEQYINGLEINRESLVNLLDTSELCVRLYSKEVINYRQQQFIFTKPTNTEKNEALLDIMTKFSIRQYKSTLECLHRSNQSHIAKLLMEGGGVLVRVHANIEGDVGNISDVDEEIVNRITEVVGNLSPELAHLHLELAQLRIAGARKGESIVIYIHCRTNDELLQLIDLLETDTMKAILEMVFTEMLLLVDALRVTLTWSQDEFRGAANFFDDNKATGRKSNGASGKYIPIFLVVMLILTIFLVWTGERQLI